MRDRRDGRTTLCPGRRLRSLQYPTQGVGTTEEHQNRSQQRHQHEQQAHGVTLHKVMKRVRKDSAVTGSHASNSVRATGPPLGNPATPTEKRHPGRGGVFAAWRGAAYRNRTDDLSLTCGWLCRLVYGGAAPLSRTLKQAPV